MSLSCVGVEEVIMVVESVSTTTKESLGSFEMAAYTRLAVPL